MNRRLGTLARPALAALALGLLAGCSARPADDPQPAPVPAVSLPAPKQAAAPAAALATPPGPGEVRVEDGPFTDRVRLTGLRLDQANAVTGHLTVTSDVSDVLALELRAAFYDTGGALVGTGTFHYQEEEESSGRHDGPHAGREGIDLTVAADHLTGTPAGAVLSLPVLVNE
ncbi:hypothetical protein BX265_5330 [Streptomyces sp. TLI_235]|nr:hypothetical protein [Streptomyces sp. TLI_235]PBC70773.1 hypothetical protein BX265_5330 [Streptomyces sp. TLI_235]